MIADAVVTDADVRTAQNVLDTWSTSRPPILTEDGASTAWVPALLELRGLLAARFADVRAAGYLEGVQEGRREAANVVVDALRGEGLTL